MKLNLSVQTILLGAAIGGALDLMFALSFAASNGIMPMRLLQIIASGLLGESAFTGGVLVAVLGLILHFLISTLFAGMFFCCAMRISWLTQKPLLSALVFGSLVFFTMRLIVLPLSAYPYPVSFKALSATLDWLSHVFLFASPIVWIAKRGMHRQSS
jgi:uncharacterized membrane protein YagU involved in acid resistance